MKNNYRFLLSALLATLGIAMLTTGSTRASESFTNTESQSAAMPPPPGGPYRSSYSMRKAPQTPVYMIQHPQWAQTQPQTAESDKGITHPVPPQWVQQAPPPQWVQQPPPHWIPPHPHMPPGYAPYGAYPPPPAWVNAPYPHYRRW